MLWLYLLLSYLCTPLLPLCVLYHWILKGNLRFALECFAIAPRCKCSNVIWIHASSVGESASVLDLVRKLRAANAGCNILFTYATGGARKLISARLGSEVVHQFAPIDHPLVVQAFLAKYKPRMTVFVESEWWPCAIFFASRYGPLLSISTRVSQRSYERWLTFPAFAKQLLSRFSFFVPQNAQEAKRVLTLSPDAVILSIGALKYSASPLPYSEKELLEFREQTRARAIVLIASSHSGEEELSLKMRLTLLAKQKNLLMIIAPRHLANIERVRALLDSRNLRYGSYSKRDKIGADTDVYLVDTIGDLGLFFRLAPITVLCGSFIPGIGGHNLIEPAMLRSAVISGPYMDKTLELRADFSEAHAAIFVEDMDECAKAIATLWRSPSMAERYVNNAISLIKKHSHVTESAVEEILKHIKA